MNIGEIAARAGVSRSTVSYALSGKRPVSPATRRRIEQVVSEADYRPNASARALKEGRTRTLGLVIPPADRMLTAAQLGFVASTLAAASRADLDVLLSPSGGEHDRSFERMVAGRRVDGVIVMELRLADERVTRLRQVRLPFVTIGRTAEPDAVTWVDVDYQGLVARTVHHLADLGHRRVALVNRSAELAAAGYGPAHRALAGFTAALRERGLAGVDVCCADTAEAGEACVRDLLAGHPELTALTTVNESALPGIRRGLARARRRVPADFSLTGVVAGHVAEDGYPELTAADVPVAQLGTRAVELLLERIADPGAPATHELHRPPISLRASTGPAPRTE